MEALLYSTAVALVFGLGALAFRSHLQWLRKRRSVFDFGMIDVDDDDTLGRFEARLVRERTGR